MPKILFSGDIVRANKTINIDGTKGGVVIKRGLLYRVRSTVISCCHHAIDIGYEHHSPISSTCSQCGEVHPPDKKIHVPVRYFAKARQQKFDALFRSVQKIENHFSLVNIKKRSITPR